MSGFISVEWGNIEHWKQTLGRGKFFSSSKKKWRFTSTFWRCGSLINNISLLGSEAIDRRHKGPNKTKIFILLWVWI